jgi:hypothetical protein
MKRIILAALFLFPATALADSPYWDSLSAAEKAQVLAGQVVTHAFDVNSTMGETSFVWVKRLTPTATPEGSAAVYWDFNGIAPVLAPAGVQSYNEVAPTGLSAKNIDAVIAIPGLPPLPYTAEATAYRLGNKRYSVRWHVPVFDIQPAPGLRQTKGFADFESFPGDGGGALFIHHASAILVPEVANDPVYKSQTIAFHIFLTQLLRDRFQQGANWLQLLKWKAAVGF